MLLDNKPDGLGVFIDRGGNKFQGSWENGKRHGKVIKIMMPAGITKFEK